MPSRLLLTSLLIIQHLQLDLHATVIPGLNTLAENPQGYDCAFPLGGYEYDLCPLIKVTTKVEDVVFNARGEGSSTGRGYREVAFGGSNMRHGGGRSEASCDDNNWVCAADPAFETVRIVTYDQPEGDGTEGTAIRLKPWGRVMATSLDKPEVDWVTSKRTLRLFFENEETSRGSSLVKPSVYVDIRCSAKHEPLKVERNQEGSYTFLWNTLHGCPLRLSRTLTSSRISAQDEPQDQENPEESPEETKGDDELMPTEKNKTRRWIAGIIIGLSVTLTCTYVLLSSSRARYFIIEHLKTASYALLPILSCIGTTLRPLTQSLTANVPKAVKRLGTRFRQGDSQLVLWAQEDMGLDSEDVMVNGEGAHPFNQDPQGWNPDQLNEYIPLTLNPKGRNRYLRSYGSMPDVETFEEERGSTGGFGRLFRK